MLFLSVSSIDICLTVQWTEDIIHINISTSVELVVAYRPLSGTFKTFRNL